MKLSEIAIVPLLASEISDAADMLGRAFVTDPMVTGLFGEITGKMTNRLAGVFSLMLGVLPSDNICVKNGERIVAVMRMVKPGECQPSRRHVLKALPRLLAATGTRMPRVLKYLSFLEKFDPEERHLHLGPFAVDPEFQRNGIGSHLLNYFSDYVDRQGVAAFLETNKATNVRLYKGYGFSTINEASLFDVPTWFMWRPPRRTLE